MNIKLLGLSLIGCVLLSGCSIKDAETCEMKNSRIILNVQLKDDSIENKELFDKIRSINQEFNISEDKTNLTNITTNFVEATSFYEQFNEIIKEETNKIETSKSDVKRYLKTSFKEKTSICLTKTLYIDGMYNQEIPNVEYILNVED